MEKLILAICIFAVFLSATPYSSEQLQGQLDSLNFLQQEAIRRGEEKNNDLSVAIKHLQTAIETQRRANTPSNNNAGVGDKSSKNDFDYGKKFIQDFAQRPIIDRLVIIMGAIAILAAMFLIFARIVLAVSQKNKLKPAKFNIKTEIAPKNANVLSEINRYKERSANLEKIAPIPIVPPSVASHSIEPIELGTEEPKKMRAREIKNEIVKRFDSGEDTAKIAQDFSMSKDQVVMILNLAGRK